MPPVAHAWRALRHRNFRLYFAGQGISLIGTWMTRIAAGWLVYRLTNSALLLGLVELHRQHHLLPARPVCRCLGRAPQPPRLLLWTQASWRLQALALAALTLAAVITSPRSPC